MKSSRIQPNPRFEELRAILGAHPNWLKPWSGAFFRFQTVDFPTAKDVISGKGASQHGGRWNSPGINVLYGSTTDTTALEECKANDRYYGVVTKAPRLLVAIEAQLSRLLDLTDPAIRRQLSITLKELSAEDWRKLQRAGQESLSQTIGRAAVAAGASGLLVRSAAVPRGINVVVFAKAHQADRLAVVEGDKLARLGVTMRT